MRNNIQQINLESIHLFFASQVKNLECIHCLDFKVQIQIYRKKFVYFLPKTAHWLQNTPIDVQIVFKLSVCFS